VLQEITKSQAPNRKQIRKRTERRNIKAETGFYLLVHPAHAHLTTVRLWMTQYRTRRAEDHQATKAILAEDRNGVSFLLLLPPLRDLRKLRVFVFCIEIRLRRMKWNIAQSGQASTQKSDEPIFLRFSTAWSLSGI